jgi:transposase
MTSERLKPSLFRGFFGMNDRDVAELLGRSRGSVIRMRKAFSQQHFGRELVGRNWGGRRYGHMSMDQERQFLSRFLDQASLGGGVNAGEIKRALEALVGHRVARTTIYRMLDRHGWRKIMPRPHHPKSDVKAQKGFKDTTQNGDAMR